MDQLAVALLVRFRSALPAEEVMRVARNRLPEFRALRGLRQKYYLHEVDAGEYAGFYLWDSPGDLEEFDASALRATIAEAYRVVGSPRVEVYSVFEVLREGAGCSATSAQPEPETRG